MSNYTFFDALNEKKIKVNPPLSESDLQTELSKHNLQPSTGLLRFWSKIGPGEISDMNIDVAKPSGPQKLDPSAYEEYSGISKVANQNVFFIGTTWDGTDSITFWYEFADGADKGNLVVFPYSALCVYKLEKTTNDLVDFLKGVKYTPDTSISAEIDKHFIGNAEPLSESDEEQSEDPEDSEYSPEDFE